MEKSKRLLLPVSPPKDVDEVVEHISLERDNDRAIKVSKLGSLILRPARDRKNRPKVIANTAQYGGDCGRRKGQQGNVRQKVAILFV